MAKNSEKGFTLIEIIMVLILLGIISAIAGMGFVIVANGYASANLNSTMVEKAQTAITRIVKELGDCNITAGTATAVTFNRQSDGTSHTFSWAGTSGDPLILNDSANSSDVLMDNISGFSLAYYDNGGNIVAATDTEQSQVQIILQITAADNLVQTVTSRVYTETQ